MENRYIELKKLKDTDSHFNISRNQILEIMEKLTKKHLEGKKPSNLEYLEVVEEIHRIINKTKKLDLYEDTIITKIVSSEEQRYMDLITLHISNGVQENIIDIYRLLYDFIRVNNYDKLTYVEIIFLGTVINIVRLKLINEACKDKFNNFKIKNNKSLHILSTLKKFKITISIFIMVFILLIVNYYYNIPYIGDVCDMLYPLLIIIYPYECIRYVVKKNI